MDLYIYYQVPAEQAEQLQTQVSAMQQALHTKFSVATELKRRPEESQGRQTWMEIYKNVPDQFAEALSSAVKAAGSPLADTDRHTETFVDLATCA